MNWPTAHCSLSFRQNASRALLMLRGQPGRRTALWLQRLRGRDLLQVCRRHADFPVIAETFRECLHDHLDVPHLQQLLSDIRAGRVEVKRAGEETPSPFASGLLFSFTVGYMYSYDRPEGEGGGAGGLDKRLLEQLVVPERQAHLLDRGDSSSRTALRGLGQPPRSATEAAEWLRRLGDLSPSELEGPMALFLHELESDGRRVASNCRRAVSRCAGSRSKRNCFIGRRSALNLRSRSRRGRRRPRSLNV